MKIWKPSTETYNAIRQAECALPNRPRSVYVTMPDGCRLATDIYLPDGDATRQYPTILIFTPYYRRFQRREDAVVEACPNTASYRDFFVPRGYAVMVTDVRGTGASFGTRDGFRSPAERRDSAVIADWAAAQPWSNGILGATGVSYLGAASDFLASTGHPAVKAIAPLFSVWDTYSDNYYPGGLQCASLTELYDRQTVGLDLNKPEYLTHSAYFTHPDFIGPHPVDEDEDGSLVAAAIEEHHGNFRQTELMADFRFREEGLPYDPDYSSASISPYSYAEGVRPDVAILSVSGWYDGAGYANGSIARFLTLKDNPHHLVLGPWDHGARTNVSPWRKAVADDTHVLGVVLRFFDKYLMGRDTGFEGLQPVQFFSMHDEMWKSADQWPPFGGTLTLCPDATGGLTGTPVEGHAEYQVDPAIGSGLHTRYERISGVAISDYYDDWQGRSAKMLSWDSAVLDAPLELAGHVLLDLNLTLDKPDAAIFAYLTEVEADGTERYITEGILRAVHRKESSAPANACATWPWRSFRRADLRPVPVGVAQQMRIPLLPVAWQLAKGSRLRLSLAGADSDHFIKVPHGPQPKMRVDLARTRLILPVPGDTTA